MSDKFTPSRVKIVQVTDNKTGKVAKYRGNRKERRAFMRANKLKVSHRTPVKPDASTEQ